MRIDQLRKKYQTGETRSPRQNSGGRSRLAWLSVVVLLLGLGLTLFLVRMNESEVVDIAELVHRIKNTTMNSLEAISNAWKRPDEVRELNDQTGITITGGVGETETSGSAAGNQFHLYKEEHMFLMNLINCLRREEEGVTTS